MARPIGPTRPVPPPQPRPELDCYIKAGKGPRHTWTATERWSADHPLWSFLLAYVICPLAGMGGAVAVVHVAMWLLAVR
jgi:hypothetical protein